jgi:hypothetical protein
MYNPIKLEVQMEPLVLVGIVQTLVLAGTILVIWKQLSTARNAQRAWVMVDVKHNAQKWADGQVHVLEGSGAGGDTTSFYAMLVCKNEGSSPGWIDEKRVKFEIVSSLPRSPHFESAQFSQAGPIPIGTAQSDSVPFEPTAVGRQEENKLTVIYGIVKYRDIFGKRRRTTFAYRILNGELRRLEGYPEYNKNT